MTPRPHDLFGCWCGQDHHEQVWCDGDDPRVRPSDLRAESQAGLTGPSGSLNPSHQRAIRRMSQDEWNSRLDAGEDPYAIAADDLASEESAQRITHGRHCTCGACAREDWEKITAPCGMHGPGCPAVYAPLGSAGSFVLAASEEPA